MGSRQALPVLLGTIALAVFAFVYVAFFRGSGRGSETEAAPRGAEELVQARPGEALERPDGAPEQAAAAPREGAAREIVERPTPDPAAAPPAEGDGGPFVRGRVVDAFGQPIAGAKVIASDRAGLPLDAIALDVPEDWARRFEAESDADGRFELRGLRPGRLRVAARAPGYAPWDEPDGTLPAVDEHELAPIVMTLGAILSGRVLDTDGHAVPGAELVVLASERAGGFAFFGGMRAPSAIADATGAFRIDQLAVGPWRVQVHDEEHPDRTFEGITERAGVEVAGLELVLEPGTTIAGRVTGVPETERGALEVRARQSGEGEFDFDSFGRARTGRVAEDGTFTVRGLKLGTTYDLQALRRRDDGRPAFGFGSWSRSERVRARAGDTGVSIAYQPESAVAFQVLDARTGDPVEEFTVESGIEWPAPQRDEDGKVRRLHPEGHARVGDLRVRSSEDRLTLRILATGYETWERTDVVLDPGQEVALGRIRLRPVPLVVVTVLDDRTGDPIEGARVTLREERPSSGDFEMRTEISIGGDDEDDHGPFGQSYVKTDELGVARLTSLEGKTCALAVRASGYAAFERTGLHLPAGETVEETARLTLGGSVLVRVVDARGAPVAGARVSHRSPSQRARGTMVLGDGGGRNVTNGEGVVTFENLEAGEHAFKLGSAFGGAFFGGGEAVMTIDGAAEDDDDWSVATVADGATSELVLEQAPRGGLAGRVRESGAPLPGATLSLARREEGRPNPMLLAFGGRGESARTDGDGRYSFDDVETGEYTLTVSHPTRRMDATFDVDVDEGTNRFDAELGVSVIEGRVLDVEGNPLPGIRVSAEQVQGSRGFVRANFIMMTDDGSDAVVTSGSGLGGESSTTDEDGRYRLRGVRPDVDLVVRGRGDRVQEGTSETVRLAVDEVKRNVDFVLELGGSVEVEALLADGAPARFCVVNAQYEDSSARVAPQFGFIQNGTTTLKGMRPGKWRLTVTRAGPGGREEAGKEQVVEIKAGKTERVTVTMD